MKQTIFALFLAFLLTTALSSVCFAAASYRLTIKDGQLAVWDCQSETWSQVTDTPVSSLPAADRFLLQNGISCSEAELKILLEDYCS